MRGKFFSFLVLPLVLLSCGDDEAGLIDPCAHKPCDPNLTCTGCSGGCGIIGNPLFSATLPPPLNPPFHLLVELELVSNTPGGNFRPCEDGEIVFEANRREILVQSIPLDERMRFCVPSSEGGLHTVSLSCREFPAHPSYGSIKRMSVIDAASNSVWP